MERGEKTGLRFEVFRKQERWIEPAVTLIVQATSLVIETHLSYIDLPFRDSLSSDIWFIGVNENRRVVTPT